MANNKISYLIFILFLISCSSKSEDYLALKSFDTQNQLQAVIEIPAGSSAKIEYNLTQNTFDQDTLNGQPRVIQFLGYPVNYGFIPSTLMVNNLKGDGDPLDVLVLGKTLKTSQVISVKPIALLQMKDDGELDNKVLSVPIDEKYKTVNIKNFKDLSENHHAIREMLGKWFLSYDKTAKIEILGWYDENMALKEIQKWQISETK